MTYEQLDFPRAGIGIDPCPCCGGSGVYSHSAAEQIARFARASDPGTSKAAGENVAKREGTNVEHVGRNTQRHLLLHAYWDTVTDSGLTSRQAAHRAGVSWVTSCPWKRVSELAQASYIHDTGRTETDPTTGSAMTLYTITRKGALMARQLGTPG